MLEISSDCFVDAHRQHQAPRRSVQTTSSADHLRLHRTQSLEHPQSRAPRFDLAVSRPRGHLQFAAQVVGEDAGLQVQSVTRPDAAGNVIDLRRGLDLADDPFLASAAVVKAQDVGSIRRLVRDNHAVFVSAADRREHVELDRFLHLSGDLLPVEEKPRRVSPTLRLPGRLEVGPGFVNPKPALSRFDHRLQCGEAQERNADGELRFHLPQQQNRSFAEKCAIEPCFDSRLWQPRSDGLETLGDEVAGAMRIVDVARAVQDIEDLRCLRHSAKQRVVAASSLALAVVSDSRPLREPSRTADAAIEVDGHALQVLTRQAIEDEVSAQVPLPVASLNVDRPQSSAPLATRCPVLSSPDQMT